VQIGFHLMTPLSPLLHIISNTIIFILHHFL
jgi:hypothetical protein